MTTFSGITVWRTTFSFRLSFRHNLAERAEAETLIVRLTTADGRAGYGQILPRDYLTGETLDGAAEDVAERWWPAVKDMRLGEGRHFVEAFFPLYGQADRERRTASYAGVDVAARMALGLYSGEQGFNNRLGEGRRLGLVGAIPAASPRKAGLLARVLKALGYRRFKVKVGTEAARDAERLHAVRKVLGKGYWLSADANQAWEWDEAETRMKALREDFGVDLVEEPLTRESGLAADYRLLERRTGVETMADEMICTTGDARELLSRGSPSWWNLRLAKNGGFMGVEAAAALARQAGVKLYGGILVGETGALAAASRAAFFAMGAECGEYGFSRVFLRGDPFRGSPAGYRGYMTAPRPDEAGVSVAGEIPGKVIFSEGS